MYIGLLGLLSEHQRPFETQLLENNMSSVVYGFTDVLIEKRSLL